MKEKLKNRGQWGSQWGFILAAAGAAIGLGNIWKFPYMAGSNGGSAFVLIYLLCVILVGLPVMIAEVLIGRYSNKNPIDALKETAVVSGASPKWQSLGWWGMFGLLLTLSFYSVVAGWSLYYLLLSLKGAFAGQSSQAIAHVWSHFLNSPGELLLYHFIFMVLTMGVVALGVEKGLERASIIMVPLLFVVLLILVCYAAFSTGGDFKQAVHFLFDPNFKKVTVNVVINALGHAFFTLAIGVGAMLMYGSYLPPRIKIMRAISFTAGLDVLVALLAGLAIFPLIFHYHIPPQAGPGLMFIALPNAFAQMAGGSVVGALFFLLLLFAAWTSSINIAEPLVAALWEKTRLTRKQACIVVGAIAWVLGIVSVLSFNLWSHVKVFGRFDLFTFITDLDTNLVLPIGGIFFCVFAGWVMKKTATQNEFATFNWLYNLWYFLVRFVAPIGIAVIFLTSL